jgi:hypothetical protein
MRVPRLLRNHKAAERWARSGDWSTRALAAALEGTELRVKQSESQHFMYTAVGREGEILSDSAAAGASSSSVPMAAGEFFRAVEGVPPPFLYFTEPLSSLSMEHRAVGWRELAPCTEQRADGEPARPPWAQLWVGSAGATTQAHYDVADNLFVQTAGRKEFLLYEPSVAAALHVFPDAHPRARKAQLRVEAPDLRLHPHAARLPPPRRVVLEPGDALLIPCFCFHHVTALTPSTSVDRDHDSHRISASFDL